MRSCLDNCFTASHTCVRRIACDQPGMHVPRRRRSCPWTTGSPTGAPAAGSLLSSGWLARSQPRRRAHRPLEQAVLLIPRCSRNNLHISAERLAGATGAAGGRAQLLAGGNSCGRECRLASGRSGPPPQRRSPNKAAALNGRRRTAACFSPKQRYQPPPCWSNALRDGGRQVRRRAAGGGSGPWLPRC